MSSKVWCQLSAAAWLYIFFSHTYIIRRSFVSSCLLSWSKFFGLFFERYMWLAGPLDIVSGTVDYCDETGGWKCQKMLWMRGWLGPHATLLCCSWIWSYPLLDERLFPELWVILILIPRWSALMSLPLNHPNIRFYVTMAARKLKNSLLSSWGCRFWWQNYHLLWQCYNQSFNTWAALDTYGGT